MTSLARLPRQNNINADEAFAFLEVVAPKLEQLRRRLATSKMLLTAGDPDKGRLDAIVESQLAFKEFVGGMANLQELVEPIDLLLEVLSQEGAELDGPAPEAPPVHVAEPAPVAIEVIEPSPSAPEPPVNPSPEPARASVAAAPAPGTARGDGWLHVGTVIAIERLLKAGMQIAGAEAYLERTYAHVGVVQADGRPISIQDIKAWRTKVLGRGSASWRRSSVLKPKAAAGLGRPQPSLADATARVDEMAAMFKKMSDLAAS